jgi:hypothetical protein
MENSATINAEEIKEKKSKPEQLELELAIVKYQDAIQKNDTNRIEKIYNEICILYPAMNFVHTWMKRYVYLYDTPEDFIQDYMRIFCTSLVSWKPKHLRKASKYNGSGDFKNYFWSSLQNNYINMVKAENSGKRSISSRCPLCDQWCASLSTHLMQNHSDYLWNLMIESGFNFDDLDTCPFCQAWKISGKLISSTIPIRKRGRPPKFNKFRQEWIELYASGETYFSIAKKYNVSYFTVRNIVVNKKIPNKIQSEIPEEIVNEWIKLFENNKTYKEIAEIYNMKYTIVYYKLKNAIKYKQESRKIVAKKLKKHILSMHSNYLFEYFKEKFPGAITGQTAKPSSVYISADDSDSDLNLYDTVGYSGKIDDLYNSGLSETQHQIIDKIFNERGRNSLVTYDTKLYNCDSDTFQAELEDLKQKLFLCGIE